MAKIVFLNPPLSLDDLYNDLGEGGSELPPLGITILAAVTRKKGHNTKIIDALALKMNCNETAKAILKENPDYLAITSTTMSIYTAAAVAKRVKEKKKVKVILGGPHITAVPKETMERFKEFDIGVIGEGEDTLIELLDKGERKNVLGLIIRENNKLIFTGKRKYIKDLDKLPFPAWDLLPNLVTYYQPAADSLNRSPATLLITSRGCTGQCLFCDRSVFGNLCRAHSADYVIKMIKHLQKEYGIKELFIEDDNFLLFKRRLKDICERIIEEKIDLTWSCMGRVDTLDPKMLKLLKKAGCWQINFGCESGSQKILDILNKEVKVEDIERAIRMTYKAGIKVKGLFMLGNFGETKETIKETLAFIKRVPLTDFHMTYFTPMPGAEAYEIADKYGEFDKSWKKVNMFNSANFIPKDLTKEELEYYYKKAWKAFYFRPRIILYYLTKLKDPLTRKKIIKGGIAFTKFLFKRK
ncbi:MAG: radical SAM protein [Candidatus Woesearchaeota archaeon]